MYPPVTSERMCALKRMTHYWEVRNALDSSSWGSAAHARWTRLDLQGVNVIHGSGMSGHGQYAVLGIIVGLIGIWLLQGAIRVAEQSPVA